MTAWTSAPEDSDEVMSLEDIDRHFADFLYGLPGNDLPELWTGAALASRETHLGHICADLAALCREFAGKPVPGKTGPVVCPRLESWLAALKAANVVGVQGEIKPLILDEAENAARLYLYRYWHYEQSLALSLREKADRCVDGLDRILLAEGLARLFPQDSTVEIDWQRIAAVVALRRNFAVITGGPGTGKTSIVVKILALLFEQNPNQRLRVALAAPTAKAAARLREAIEAERNKLPCSHEILAQLPTEAVTLHRLLGSRPDSTKLRYHAENRLPLDLLVIDEVSMVDLPLMAKTLQALPNHARLILFGDRDQLASVEPGRVFRDICGNARANAFSKEFASDLTALSEVPVPVRAEAGAAPLLGDSVVVLERNYRFGASSGIGALSRAVNSGDSQHAMELLLSGGSGDLAWRDLPDRIQMAKALEPLILGGYADLFQAASVEAGFAALSRFRILCAIREGPYGVAAVNALAEELHRKANRTPLARWWYAGQPFLITVNDYSLRLFNGDVGLAFPSGSNGFSEGALKAYFEREENTYRTLLLQRLPDHTPVYAMTVHRSQGSEYDRVLLILPDRPLPVVTRELVYTAITRARCSVEIWGRREHFEKAIKTRIERTSGLHCLLHSSALLR